VSATWVDYNFVNVYGFDVVAGRNFSEDVPSDLDTAVLINESGARLVGYDSAEDAVGGRLIFGGSNPAEVIGVLRDFDWMSAKQAQSAVILALSPGGSLYSVKLAGTDISGVIERLGARFQAHFPGNGFEYYFADERFNDLYESEMRLRTLVGLFAGFALLVAALGLIGLAALTSAQRFREISIRKVLGAGDLTIARLLTGHFAVLVGLGLMLAVPVVYVVADNWLNGFASHISLSADAFVLPGLAVLALALMTSAYHVVRAARSNPIDGIRNE
jgi:putative ABC transport system permease protein